MFYAKKDQRTGWFYDVMMYWMWFGLQLAISTHLLTPYSTHRATNQYYETQIRCTYKLGCLIWEKFYQRSTAVLQSLAESFNWIMGQTSKRLIDDYRTACCWFHCGWKFLERSTHFDLNSELLATVINLVALLCAVLILGSFCNRFVAQSTWLKCPS